MTEAHMPEVQLARASMAVEILTAEADGDKGMVEALVSAYDVRYRMGFATYHTIKPGAFADSIAAQDAIPMFWMHNWDWTEQPPIGHGVASEVTTPKPGLKIAGELYLDQPGVTPIFRALKAKALREWSIGYQILEYTEDPDDDLSQIITRAQLLEASSVLKGANPDTETLKVASLSPVRLQKAAAAFAAAARALDELTVDAGGPSGDAGDAPAPAVEDAMPAPRANPDEPPGQDADDRAGPAEAQLDYLAEAKREITAARNHRRSKATF